MKAREWGGGGGGEVLHVCKEYSSKKGKPPSLVDLQTAANFQFFQNISRLVLRLKTFSSSAICRCPLLKDAGAVSVLGLCIQVLGCQHGFLGFSLICGIQDLLDELDDLQKTIPVMYLVK